MKNEELDIAKLRALYEATTEPGNRWISSAPTYEHNNFRVYTSGPGPCRGIVEVAELRRNTDGVFIAAIRNATPTLLDAAERCRGDTLAADPSRWPHEARIANLQARCLAETARADEAEKNYRFMVERAADQKLDGYRELGSRAAAAENGRDDLARRLAAADERIAILVEANDALAEMAKESVDEAFEIEQTALHAARRVEVAEQALMEITSITFTSRSAQEIAKAALSTMKAIP